MVKKFAFWLEGIFEDDPLPIEINVLVFLKKQKGLYNYLELQGFEKEYNENSIAFNPLEAQFFNCKELSSLDDINFDIKVQKIIDDAFLNITLKKQLKNTKIFYKNEKKLIYLFKI